jgi:nucleotide-binding universal stress UspA family protein
MHTPRILVPTDFDDQAQTTLCYARKLAATLRAELHVLHVVPDAAREPWAAEAAGLNLDELTSDGFGTPTSACTR